MEGVLAGPSPCYLSESREMELTNYLQFLTDIVNASGCVKLADGYQVQTRHLLSKLLNSGLPPEQLALKEEIWVLLVRAITHVLKLVTSQACPSAVADGNAATFLVSGLMQDYRLLTEKLSLDDLIIQRQYDSTIKQLRRSAASDLLPALAQYSQQVVIGLQQLASHTDQHIQQQQTLPTPKQQKTASQESFKLLQRHVICAYHIQELLCFWRLLLYDLRAMLHPSTLYLIFLPAAINLTASAAPTLAKGVTLASYADSTNTPVTVPFGSLRMMANNEEKAADYASCYKYVMRRSLALSIATAAMLPPEGEAANFSAADSEQQHQHQYQLQQHLLLADGLSWPLLLVLAHQAAKLHANEPRQLTPNSAAGQQQQQQSKDRRLGIVDSHEQLLTAMGLPNMGEAIVSDGHHYDRVRNSHMCLCALRALSSSILQQQQDPLSKDHCAFPDHLVVPTVKVLIQICLLLPSDDVSIRAASLELVMQLLHISAAEQPAEALAEAQVDQLSADEQQATTAAATTDAVVDCPWPVLPAAVAAGLLHPVVQLLSQAVLLALVETEPQQQQQQGDTGVATEAARMSMLHFFGSLLITVCCSVESKHIVAALRADPSIPLAAVQAVIRTQACHLLSDSSDQQQQQQQPPCHQEQQSQSAASTANLCHSSTLPGKARFAIPASRPGASVLLPFLLKLFSSVVDMFENPQFQNTLMQQLHSHNLGYLDDLCMRVLGLTSTANKVSQMATAQCAMMREVVVDPRETAAAAEWMTVIEDAEDQVDDWYIRSAHSIANAANMLNNVVCAVAEMACDLQGRKGVQQSQNHVVDVGKLGATTSSTLSVNIPLAILLKVLQRSVHHWLSDINVQGRPPTSNGPNGEASRTDSESAPLAAGNLMSPLASIVSIVLVLPGALTHFRELESMLKLTFGSVITKKFRPENGDVQHLCPVQHEQIEQWQQLTRLGRTLLVDCAHMSTGECELKVTDGGDVSADRLVSGMKRDVTSFYQQLRDCASSILARFPVSLCCNNPSCVNLSKLSEYQLVSSKASVCGGCKVARYCSRECQKKHWKMHKPVCHHLSNV